MGDIFILPSVGPGETWGLAINEAMASGRPVIVSDKVGCATDLVEENKNGIVCSRDSVAICAELIEELSRDKRRSREMGNYSRELIRQFTFKKIVDAVRQVVEKS